MTRAGTSLPALVLIAPIRFYQRFITPYTPATCRYYPTCSAYAVTALRSRGALVGTLLTAWRENQLACPLETGQSPAEIPLPPGNCIHLKATSATGGMARFVAFTGAQLMADAENIVVAMGLRPDWPNLGVISLAHSYGFSNLVLPLLLHGIPLRLAPAPLPEIIRRAAENEPGITLPAVPALWRAWHQAHAIPPNVRLAISAGAPLPVHLEQQVFKACGVKIHNFLGSSECGGIAYDPSRTPRNDPTFVGSPMPGVRLSLNDAGCLVVRSRAMAETYWPDKSDYLGDGIFQTSDLAELTGGKVFLRGRAGDQINVAGRKLSPELVERALLAHPQVRECLVFGVPSHAAERTENIVAIIATNATEAILKSFLLQTLPAWQAGLISAAYLFSSFCRSCTMALQNPLIEIKPPAENDNPARPQAALKQPPSSKQEP